MLDLSFANILHSNAFNFVLLLIILAWIVMKIDLRGMFENSRSKIEDNVQVVEGEKLRSEQELEVVKQELEYLPKKIDDIFDQSDANAEKMSDKIRKEIAIELEKIEQMTKKQAQRESVKVQLELTKRYVGEVVLSLKSDIKQALDRDLELHKKLNNNFIDRLESMEVTIGTNF